VVRSCEPIDKNRIVCVGEKCDLVQIRDAFLIKVRLPTTVSAAQKAVGKAFMHAGAFHFIL
jgi:hypothetical protein